VAIEIAYDQSSAGLAGSNRDVHILGIHSGGTASDNDVSTVAFADSAAADSFYGTGTLGAWMYRQVARIRGGRTHKGQIFGHAAPDDATGALATQTYTFAAGPTGTAGEYTVNCAGAVFSFSVAAGATDTVSAAAMVTAFGNLDSDNKPPCTIANAAGVVTLTAKHKDECYNTAPTYKIVTGDEPTTQTLTVGGATMSGASASGILTTLLAKLASVETPFLLSPSNLVDGSAENLDLILAHCETKSNAENMLSSNLVCCADDTAANHATAAGNLDSKRARYGTVQTSGSWSVNHACWMANALLCESNVTRPFDGWEFPYAVAPPDVADYWTNTELDTLIEAGCTPINFNPQSGNTEIVYGVCADLYGGTTPVDWGDIDGLDYFRSRVHAELSAQFVRYKIGDDGDPGLDEYTTTPQGILDVIYNVAKGTDMKGILRDVDDLWPNAVAEIHATSPGRVDFQVDAATFRGLHQKFGKIRQRRGSY
jgi:phage tail sheath gpL-like